MADVLPFAGTRYSTKDHQINLAEVIAPPYDSIPASLQRELHERNPHNVVRLEYGYEAASDDEGNNRYTRSAECYREWKAKGILADEQRKCFYVYEQTYKMPGVEKPVRRLGFFALVKLQDFRSGKIRAFERTHDTPKLDRLKLLRTMQVNPSPLHILYNDEERAIGEVLEEVVKSEPTEDFKDGDGTRHRVWLLHKKEPILKIHEAMKPKRLYIADGHHRYETALKYRDEMREMTGRRDGRQPYDFTLMFLQRAEDEAIASLPLHRVLARELGVDTDIDEVIEDLEQYFTLSEFKLNVKDLAKAAATIDDKIVPAKNVKTRFVMALPTGRAWVLSLRKDADVNEMIEEETMSELLKSMDVTILHKYVISRGWIGNPEVEMDEDDIFFRSNTLEVLELLQKRKGCVAFFMNPTSKQDVLNVAENGELLPHSSVEFVPKISSGVVLRDLNVGFG